MPHSSIRRAPKVPFTNQGSITVEFDLSHRSIRRLAASCVTLASDLEAVPDDEYIERLDQLADSAALLSAVARNARWPEPS